MFALKNKSSTSSGKKGKFPFYHQHDAMDCGPACLRMVAHAYGRKHSLQHLRDLSNISRRGVNMQGIGDAAESIGLRTMGVRTSFDKLSEKAQLPCIVHWRQVHFAVVYRIEKSKPHGKNQTEQVLVYVADPAHGLLKYTENEFKQSWVTTFHEGQGKGIALLLEPTPYFYQAKAEIHQPVNLRFLINYLHPYKKLMWQLLWGIIAGSLLQLIFPFLTQAIVDQGIGKKT